MLEETAIHNPVHFFLEFRRLVGLDTEQLGQGYLAVNWEATVDDMAALIQPHPTMTEVLGEAIISLTGRPLHG